MFGPPIVVGNGVSLAAPEETHAVLLAVWLNDPDVMRPLDADWTPENPVTEASAKAAFQACRSSGCSLVIRAASMWLVRPDTSTAGRLTHVTRMPGTAYYVHEMSSSNSSGKPGLF